MGMGLDLVARIRKRYGGLFYRSRSIVAIDGKTTGTIIRSGNVTWELDLSGDPKLTAAAEKLNKQKVIASGAYYKKKGVEVAERHIVKVKSLKAADSK